MKFKRFFSLLAACVFAVGCFVMPVSAVTDYDTESRAVIRATDQFEESIPAKSLMPLGDSISLDISETISYNCSYTPKNASVDFGFIAPDGYFYYINCTTGRINRTVRVSQRGSYTLAIWNNSDETVTVSGTVNY